MRARLLYLVPVLALLAGCRQDMFDQPKYKPLAQSDFFGDERSARPIVPGTVARGHLRADESLYTGKTGGKLVETIPIPVTKEVFLRGQQRFNIFCSPCHGRDGYGTGMVVRRGYQSPPSYHIDRLRQAPAGHFFDVMTNGFGAMPSYGAQVPVMDRWAIAAYIRALQFSQNAPLDAAPQQERQKLQATSQ